MVELDNVFFDLPTLLLELFDTPKGGLCAMCFGEGSPQGSHKVMPQGFVIVLVGWRVNSVSSYFNDPLLGFLGHTFIDSRAVE